MKKQLLTLVCFALCCQAWAKDTKSTVPVIYPYFNVGNGGDQSPMVNTRLIGRVCYTHNGQTLMPFDSVTYNYSSGRSGMLSDNMTDEYLKFDVSVSYLYDNGAAEYIPSEKRTQEFDYYNKILRYFTKIWKANTGTWKDTGRYAYYYDLNNKLEEATLDRWQGSAGWVSRDYYANKYSDVSGNLIEVSGHEYKIIISYDAEGRVTEYVEQKRSLLNPVFTNDIRTTYEYLTGFNYKAQVIEKWDGSNWVPQSREEYSYNGAGLLTETLMLSWNGSSWTEYQKLADSYDANGNRILRIRQQWLNSSFTDTRREQWTYNVSSQPLTYNLTTWNVGATAWQATDGDTTLRFYYEHFNPTSINNLAKNAELSVYPVPATDAINMAVLFDKSQEYDLSLIDMHGRVVYQSHHPAAKVATATVPVSTLPSGQYILHVVGTQQSASKQIIVAK